jgi:uncharacterized protein YndB with AHSA1/START domain
MAIVRTYIDAPPAAVYRVLSDGWEYPQWVVGTSHMRAVDAAWPAPGSRLHHAVGAWPFVLRDRTEVREIEPDRRVLMTARGWPLGEAEVELILEPEGPGTRLSMREDTRGGAGWLLRNPVGHLLIYRRNVESVARLAALVERRTSPSEGG